MATYKLDGYQPTHGQTIDGVYYAFQIEQIDRVRGNIDVRGTLRTPDPSGVCDMLCVRPGTDDYRRVMAIMNRAVKIRAQDWLERQGLGGK